jgi:HicB family
VAVELGPALPDYRVEVRLIGSDAQLVPVEVEPVEAANDEDGAGSEPDAEARITLRLPAHLKARVEAASAFEGVSVNTYIVRALSHGTRGGRGPKGGHRMKGHGHI